MDFFDFDFDFEDCLRAVLAAVFLLGSVQLQAVLSERLLLPADGTGSPPSAVGAKTLSPASPSSPGKQGQ